MLPIIILYYLIYIFLLLEFVDIFYLYFSLFESLLELEKERKIKIKNYNYNYN